MSLRILRWTAAFHQATHWASVGVILPVMSLLQISKGLNLSDIGVTIGAYSLTVVVLELPTGALADSIGRRRTYLYSVLIQIVALGAIASATSTATMVAGFIILGISRALSSGSIEAHFVDAFYTVDPNGDLNRFMSHIGIFIPIGLATGALLGGFVPDVFGDLFVSLRRFDRYAANAIVAILISVIQIVITVLFVQRDTPAAAPVVQTASSTASAPTVPAAVTVDDAPMAWRARRGIDMRVVVDEGIRNRTVFLLLIATAAWGISFSGLETFWQPFVNALRGGAERGGTVSSSRTAIFGYLTTAYFLAGAAGNAIAAACSPLIRRRLAPTVAILRVVGGIVFITLSLQTGIVQFTIFYVFLFSINGMMSGPEDALFNAAVPSAVRSTLLSVRSLAMQLGGALGVFAMGYIAQRYSIALVWQIGGAFFAASSCIYLLVHRESRRAATIPATAKA